MNFIVLPPVILAPFRTLAPIVMLPFISLKPAIMVIGTDVYGNLTESPLYPGLWS